MIKTKILKVKGDWKEILNDCRFTANKEDLNKEPSDKFKKKILIAEHSPIRDRAFKWEWELPHWVGVHWVRHKWECFVSTQRTDRTGVDRTKLPQDIEQGFRGEANTQHLIDTMRKRLCLTASPETRECAISLKKEITKIDKFTGDVLVPNCIYRCGCPEDNDCPFFDNFASTFPLEGKNIFKIQDRYDIYNELFYKTNKEKTE